MSDSAADGVFVPYVRDAQGLRNLNGQLIGAGSIRRAFLSHDSSKLIVHYRTAGKAWLSFVTIADGTAVNVDLGDEANQYSIQQNPVYDSFLVNITLASTALYDGLLVNGDGTTTDPGYEGDFQFRGWAPDGEHYAILDEAITSLLPAIVIVDRFGNYTNALRPSLGTDYSFRSGIWDRVGNRYLAEVVTVSTGGSTQSQWYSHDVATGIHADATDILSSNSSTVRASYDGQWLSFVNRNETNPSREDLFITATDGTLAQFSVSNSYLGENGEIPNYRWSPNGNRLAYFNQHRDPMSLDLTLTDTNGNASLPYPIPLWDARVTDAVWSPSGTHLAYCADHVMPGRQDLYVLDVAAGTSPVLAKENAFPLGTAEPAWSPDGQWIVLGMSETGGTDGPVVALRLNNLSDEVLISSNALRTMRVGLALEAYWSISPDSKGVYWPRAHSTNGSEELLYTSFVNPTDQVVLTGEVAAGGDGELLYFFAQ